MRETIKMHTGIITKTIQNDIYYVTIFSWNIRHFSQLNRYKSVQYVF